MSNPDAGPPGAREFPSTSWSAIRHGADANAPDYRNHLERLVRLYWRPVFTVIRRLWSKTEDEAKDLTQEFFTTRILDGSLLRSFSPDRGSFRGLLKTAIANFVLDVRKEGQRQKRGGGVSVISFDGTDGTLGDSLPDTSAATPDELFDAAWRDLVMARALEELEHRLTEAGKRTSFEVFRRYDLDPQREQRSYAKLGTELGLSGDRVKHALTEARLALRDIIIEIARDYVDGPQELASELRTLLGPR
jgi:RNA polymerase sigma-70 factor (ECF subfamily)